MARYWVDGIPEPLVVDDGGVTENETNGFYDPEGTVEEINEWNDRIRALPEDYGSMVLHVVEADERAYYVEPCPRPVDECRHEDDAILDLGDLGHGHKDEAGIYTYFDTPKGERLVMLTGVPFDRAEP